MEDNNDNIVVRYDLPKNWSEEKNFLMTKKCDAVAPIFDFCDIVE